MGKSVLTQILVRDENGKPKLNLTPIENAVIKTTGEEDFTELMRVCECGGLTGIVNDSHEFIPSTIPYCFIWKAPRDFYINAQFGFNKRGEKTFTFSNEVLSGSKVISPDEFYNSQIPPICEEMLDEIKKYFETGK
jgi:hypothetical protein